MIRPFLSVPAYVVLLSAGIYGQQAVNQDAALIEEFEKRVQEYLKLRKTVADKHPKLKPTNSTAAITHHEHEFAEATRKARSHARQGDIFTPAITGEFHRLIGLAMQGSDKTHVEQSLKRAAEPVPKRPLRVNSVYPPGVPLQSTPPTLLLNLPRLPKELDYRVVGHDLVLRDTEANLIIDFLPDAVP